MQLCQTLGVACAVEALPLCRSAPPSITAGSQRSEVSVISTGIDTATTPVRKTTYNRSAIARVLASLFCHESMWLLVESVVGRSASSGADTALAALALITALLRHGPVEVVVGTMPRLHALISSAISSSDHRDGRLSKSIADLLPALASRVGGQTPVDREPCAGGRKRGSCAAHHILRSGFKCRVSPLLEISCRHRLRLLWGSNLDKLCTQQLPLLRSGSYPAGHQQYLETLYRLLRADGLNKIIAGVGALHRGVDIPDRDLKMYEDVRVIGYCAARGGL